jgi:hypothetical protein
MSTNDRLHLEDLTLLACATPDANMFADIAPRLLARCNVYFTSSPTEEALNRLFTIALTHKFKVQIESSLLIVRKDEMKNARHRSRQ